VIMVGRSRVITFWVEDEVYEQLKRIAIAKNKSLSEIIREALSDLIPEITWDDDVSGTEKA